MKWEPTHIGKTEAAKLGMNPGWYVLGYHEGDTDPMAELFVAYAYSPSHEDARDNLAQRVADALNLTEGNQQVEAGDPDTPAS